MSWIRRIETLTLRRLPHPTLGAAAVIVVLAVMVLPAPLLASGSYGWAAGDTLHYTLDDSLDGTLDDSLGESLGESARVSPAAQLRSRLLYDTIAAGRSLDRSDAVGSSSEARRSVPLAFGLSAALPGAGQVYNRTWIRAAGAFIVESGLILGYVLWKDRGQDAEAAYKNYAHEHWDPGQYAAWLNDYVDYLEEVDGGSLGVDDIPIPQGIDFSEPLAWSPQERQAVRSFFDEVRAVEDEVYHPETGAAFSHNLPYFAEQQYYELIGKYFQFAPGWADYPRWKEGDAFTDAIDPERTGSDGTKPNVQGRFLEYASDHADANTLLRRASRASAFLVLHHVVAAFDAAISAKLHNDRIQTGVELGMDRFQQPQLSAALSVRL